MDLWEKVDVSEVTLSGSINELSMVPAKYIQYVLLLVYSQDDDYHKVASLNFYNHFTAKFALEAWIFRKFRQFCIAFNHFWPVFGRIKGWLKKSAQHLH